MLQRVPFSLPYPAALFDQLDRFMLEFEQHDKEVEAGVASVGPASEYALIWEWGNIRQHTIGPRTTLGVNPDGESVWLSIQAPYGYIRLHTEQYWHIIGEEMDAVRFKSDSTTDITDALRGAARRSVRRIADVIREAVPVDSGELYRGIQVVDPEEYAGLELDVNASGRQTLLLEEA